MASQKEKYIASAQKFLLKGQIDRAIKDYEEVVALDPTDIRNRQKLAELLVKAGRKDDAVREYETIGKGYDDKGFFLKAIAVYKQIQKLDPANLNVCLVLGELNQKQGLIGNALAEYKTLLDHYEKKNELNEAVKVIEKMLTVDPENLNILLKLAETYHSLGLEDSSYQCYTKVALTLKKRGEEKLFDQVCVRIRDHFPRKADLLVDMAAEQLKSGDAAGAINRLSAILDKSPCDLAALRILMEAYKQIGDTENLRCACERLIGAAPDELSAKVLLFESYVDAGDAENALGRLHLYRKSFIDAGTMTELDGYFRRLLVIAPENIALLEEVREIYELSGDTVGRDLIASKIDRLRQEEAAAMSEITAQAPEAQLEEPVAPFAEETESPEEPGIELELPEEPVDFEIEVQQPVVPEEAPVVPQMEQPPLDFEEIELELDIPEEDAIAVEPGGVAAGFDLSLDTEMPVSFDEIPENPEESSVAAPQALKAETAASEVESIFEGADFELELEGAFAVEPEQSLSATAVAAEQHSKYALDDVFSEFKKGVDRQVGKEDTETHYNLGIAYMEMGLFDDAVQEFRNASRDPGRRVDCQTLRALCFRNKGDLQTAERTLREGLDLPGLEREEVLGLNYELALVHELSGDTDSALRMFQEVAAIAPDFRDTRKKIESLLGIGDLDEQETDMELIDLDQEEIE